MRVFALVAALFSSTVGPVMAGPMPVLPDLPPLPTTYVSVGTDGLYAGILAGYSSNGPGGAALGIVVGNTVRASDLLIGVEGLALVSNGDAEIEAGVRIGLPLTDALSVFGNAGLGHSTATGAFASIGISTDFLLTSDVALRLDYRYGHDLSGDPANHRILGGLVRAF
ncbi:hypothetical protein [Devosia sp.]|uniref:hypothetical protein n=1 Tax=Devosia sp. TaxID=1871048 RepID=UPI002FCB701B